jgi:hypothetical protein
MNDTYKVKNQRKAIQIGFFEARAVRRKGIRDGALGLQPKQDESGIWLSPYVQRELAAYREQTKHEWLQCEVDTAECQIQAEKLRQQILRLKDKQKRSSGSLAVRFRGEESLDSHVIDSRRNREFNNLEHLEDEYHELIQKISEHESGVKLFCLRIEENTLGRLSIYIQGCMESNPGVQLPPVSSIIIHSDAEEVYMKRHDRSLAPTTVTESRNDGGHMNA